MKVVLRSETTMSVSLIVPRTVSSPDSASGRDGVDTVDVADQGGGASHATTAAHAVN